MILKRLTQITLSFLVIPIIGLTTGFATVAYVGSTVLAQSSETPSQPEQPASPAEPAAESPEEPAEPAEPAAPAEAAKPASNVNWLLIGGGVVAVLVLITLISSLSHRSSNRE